ncbi:hypothetical protein [Ruegeria arenilitoris]|uniref:hypothetical protein n=1 Tax=Ruegeria arenilitoris TaxID=1173585 RepID=UPI00147E1B2F|nr:hypothetical protein [Ruegeria arenilitoris]
MNRITPEALYALLPAHTRVRDAEMGGPLQAFVALLAREGAVLEENIEQLLDNAFIETCAPWAVPYIGGTIGYRALHNVGGAAAGTRAEAANTIPYRRRKGTPAVLEQLAADVTGWPAKVVEYFQLVAACQHMNHIRLSPRGIAEHLPARPDHHVTANLRDPARMEQLGTAFDPVTRSVDVRSIERNPGRKSIGGRHHLPNIGLHLYRLLPLSVSRVALRPAEAGDARRFLFDPLGAPRQLFQFPLPQDAITTLARPEHMPLPITRRMLDADPALWYGPNRGFVLWQGDDPIPLTDIIACDLSDDGLGWNHTPHPSGAEPLIRVDPELGRLSFPEDQAEPILATWHRGFPGRIGGGEYDRSREVVLRPGDDPVVVTGDATELVQALNNLPSQGGIVEIDSNAVLDLPNSFTIEVEADAEIILRAQDGRRPILRGDQVTLRGGSDSRIELNGLVLDGGPLVIAPNGDGESLSDVRLRHLTLIPGHSYTASGGTVSPGAASIEITTVGTELDVTACISGPMVLGDTTTVDITDSFIDAAAADPFDSLNGFAISGSGGAPAGSLSMAGTTVFGHIFVRVMPLVSNSILRAGDADDTVPVQVLHRQEGCIRFSFVPLGSIVPRRYRCQPQLAIDAAIEAAEEASGAPLSSVLSAEISERIATWLVPSFTAITSAHPAYGQLREAAPIEIRHGAEDGGEMGVWHHLHAPQRETNLRIRLPEYLRFGLEAGLFYET